MQVEFGNAGDVPTHGTGWFIGFSEWARSGAAPLRYMPAGQHATGLCVKWFHHEAGHPNGDPKPISEGRSISLLVGQASEFRLEFAPSPRFEPNDTLAYTLRRPGDFVIWGGGIYHRAFGLQRACILTIRWTPVA
jgi:hypothetical protein